jgi:16S rRNA (guanine966-N2)-methyltransferase
LRKRLDSRPRILSGRWKGRVLQVPKSARPTSSRGREALFDVLQDSIPGARVLDLYAGSGAVGLEALSRGAAKAVFVETDVQALEANLVAVGAARDEFDVVRSEARDAVASLLRCGETFHLVFADPPYAAEQSALPARMSELLVPDGTLVVQTDSRAALGVPRGLSVDDRRGYGRNVFWFLTRKMA